MSQYHEYFTLNGEQSRNYGIWISGEGTFVAPERDVTIYEVPGRNGTLTLDNGRWKNVQITYPCYMSNNFLTGFDTFKNKMLSFRGYEDLFDTYHPDGFRMARLSKWSQPKTGPFNRSASFTLTFDCYPQFYLNSGNTATLFTGSGTLSDIPLNSFSRPLVVVMLAVRGNNSGSITIGNTTMSFTNVSGGTPGTTRLDIDCEARTMKVMDTSVANKFTLDSGDFFTIEPPSMAVSFTGDIQWIRITPRWWIL